MTCHEADSAEATGVSLENYRTAGTLSRGRAVNSNAPEPALPSDVLRNWQRIVDLLANIIRCSFGGGDQTGTAALHTLQNAGLQQPEGTGFRSMRPSLWMSEPIARPSSKPVNRCLSRMLCKTVSGSRLPTSSWGSSHYLGFPVSWPDGQISGTICVVDDKANRFSDLYQQLLLHCRDVLQGDLPTLARLGNELEERRAQLSELFARVPDAVVMVDRNSRITRVNPGFTKILGIGRKKRSVSEPRILLRQTTFRRRSKALCTGWPRREKYSPLRPSGGIRMA